MLTIENYEQIAKNKKQFIIWNSIALLFLGGIFFTFVIPMTKDFSLYIFMLYAIMCFFISNIYAGIYRKSNWFKVFISTLVLHSLGLLWRVVLEWGEFIISKYLTPTIVIGYIFSVPVFITILYLIIGKMQQFKRVKYDDKLGKMPFNNK